MQKQEQKTKNRNKSAHLTVVKIELEIPYGCVCTGAGDYAHAYIHMHTSSYVTTIPPESPAYPFVCQKHDAALGMFFSNNFHACMRAFGSTGHALQGRTSTDRQRPRSFPRNQPDRYFH